MTPWEMAYHFPSKFKEYVMANFPDGKMPAAGQATQEGLRPPTSRQFQCSLCKKTWTQSVPSGDTAALLAVYEWMGKSYYCDECAVIARLAIALF